VNLGKYSNAGVSFSFPRAWAVAEDDFDEFIRAITIEDENEGEGIYMIDIYKSEQAPSLEMYKSRQMESFLNSLPLGAEIVGTPQVTKIESKLGSDIEGIEVTFTISMPLVDNIHYISSYYKITSGGKTGLLSSQYPLENEFESRKGFEVIVGSFYAE